MKTIIIYASKHGSVKRCVTLLNERIVTKPTLVNVYEKHTYNLEDYDVVIIGASIYHGRIQKEIEDFCIDNLEVLLTKKLGIFISSALRHQDEFSLNFSPKLLAHATCTDNFGYELYMHDFNFLEKLILKFIPTEYLENYGIKINEVESFIKRLHLNN